MSSEASEGGSKIVRVILISLGIVAFFSVVSSTYQIMNENNPDLLNNCVGKHVQVSANGSPVASKDEGARLLQNSIGGSFTFLSNTLEVCDPSYTGYVYLSQNNNMYVACGNGEIYLYESSCKEDGKAKSFISTIMQAKSSNISIK